PATPVLVDAFADHVFGVVLLNDWSARDLQAWEYVPLGPFLGKSFATSISAWVTPLDALCAARAPLPPQDPTPLPYLLPHDHRDDSPPSPALPTSPAPTTLPALPTSPAPTTLPALPTSPAPTTLPAYDLALEVEVNGTVISRPPYAAMYWSPAQMLAHLTANGASLRVGDLFASGTVSGDTPDQTGSLLERCWNGTRPVTLADGSTRAFLADGDTVTIRATCPGTGGGRIALGEVTGTIRPSGWTR
ncbi:MAG: fumarylacetoacetate hydrolase family protein, partial [Angustibacter sp.]